MKRTMFLAFVASAALLMLFAGSVAEARHWNRGYSRPHVHYGYNGFRGNYWPNYRSHYRPVYPHYRYHAPYQWNGYGNTYYNPYYYGNGFYYGSNNAGIYFRY